MIIIIIKEINKINVRAHSRIYRAWQALFGQVLRGSWQRKIFMVRKRKKQVDNKLVNIWSYSKMNSSFVFCFFVFFFGGGERTITFVVATAIYCHPFSYYTMDTWEYCICLYYRWSVREYFYFFSLCLRPYHWKYWKH